MARTERRRFDFLRFTNEYKYKSFENSQILNSKKIKFGLSSKHTVNCFIQP